MYFRQFANASINIPFSKFFCKIVGLICAFLILMAGSQVVSGSMVEYFQYFIKLLINYYRQKNN